MKRLISMTVASAIALATFGANTALAQNYGPPGGGYHPEHHEGYGPPGGGPGYHQWHQGDHFYGDRRYVDYHHYGLRPPPRGYGWVQDRTGEFVLIAIGSGVIADILLNHQ